MDILNMFGGILKLFGSSLGKLGLFMAIVFFIWFILKVAQSMREDLQFFKCDHIANKLPLYKQAMEELKK
jgi:hypothetical protein